MKKKHIGIVLLLCFLSIQVFLSCAPVLLKNSTTISEMISDIDDSEDHDDSQEDEDESNKSFSEDDLEMLPIENDLFFPIFNNQKSIYFYFQVELNSTTSYCFCPPELV
jgi:hypothetical protein